MKDSKWGPILKKRKGNTNELTSKFSTALLSLSDEALL